MQTDIAPPSTTVREGLMGRGSSLTRWDFQMQQFCSAEEELLLQGCGFGQVVVRGHNRPQNPGQRQHQCPWETVPGGRTFLITRHKKRMQEACRSVPRPIAMGKKETTKPSIRGNRGRDGAAPGCHTTGWQVCPPSPPVYKGDKELPPSNAYFSALWSLGT